MAAVVSAYSSADRERDRKVAGPRNDVRKFNQLMMSINVHTDEVPQINNEFNMLLVILTFDLIHLN